MYRSPLVWKSVIVATCAVLTTTAAANAGTSTLVGARSNGRPEELNRVYVPMAARMRELAFVGLTLRYEFTGWIRGSEYTDVRGVDTGNFDLAVSSDVLRINWRREYTQNPYGWAGETWTSFYSLSQSAWVGSSGSSDPAWKWGSPMFLPRSWTLINGGQVFVDGQPFQVVGPMNGYSAFGMPYSYWQLTNLQSLLYYAESGYAQYVLPGDAVLRYDADGRRIRTYASVKRTEYRNGYPNGDTIQYVDQLTIYSPGWVSVRVEAPRADPERMVSGTLASAQADGPVTR